MYHTELIKSQSANGVKNRVQTWLDEQYGKNRNFTVISVSYAFENGEGYRAFITFTN